MTCSVLSFAVVDRIKKWLFPVASTNVCEGCSDCVLRFLFYSWSFNSNVRVQGNTKSHLPNTTTNSPPRSGSLEHGFYARPRLSSLESRLAGKRQLLRLRPFCCQPADTLALCSSGVLLVQCLVIRHLSVPLGTGVAKTFR